MHNFRPIWLQYDSRQKKTPVLARRIRTLGTCSTLSRSFFLAIYFPFRCWSLSAALRYSLRCCGKKYSPLSIARSSLDGCCGGGKGVYAFLWRTLKGWRRLLCFFLWNLGRNLQQTCNDIERKTKRTICWNKAVREGSWMIRYWSRCDVALC